MEVVWSDLALTQLDEVLDYVEEHFGLLTSQEVLHNILEKTDELAQYSTHGIYDARYTSWVSGQNMVIRHLLIAPNRVYYLIDGEQVVIMGIVHVKRPPQAVTSMIKRFLEEYDKPTKLYLLALPNQEIMMETNDAIYVMELKFNKSAEEALAQIDAKHYADAFKMSGKTS